MISRFITTIYNLYPEATAEDIADAIWLASHIGTSETSDMVQSEDDDASPEERTPWASRDATRSSSQPDTRRSGSTKTSGETDSHAHLLAAQIGQDRPGGLPFRTPAASALPGSLSIGRSLRPFMRRVPSRTKFTLDEQSTAQRIAEERLWIPVLNPALTHWFEVALIIDASASMIIWRQTIAELQLLLERQGA